MPSPSPSPDPDSRLPVRRRRAAAAALSTLVALAASPAATAEDLEIVAVATIVPEASTERTVRLDVRWRNGWHDERNHDGAWIFLRRGSRPMRIAAAGHEVVARAAVELEVAADGYGVWVVPRAPHRGNVEASLILRLEADPDDRSRATIQAHGIEMVHVPGGPFWLGDPGALAREYGAFHRAGSAPDSGLDGLIRVAGESALPVGGPGELTYRPGNGDYAGDGQGPIPAAFPKGTRAFWIMKYELTEGLYAAFLNDLSDSATYERARLGGRSYHAGGGSIGLRDGRYVAERPDQPARHMSWDDQLAFTDWAGLRPMTELEFTRAARGPRTPIAGEYPWGSASRDRLLRLPEASGRPRQLDGRDESELTVDTLAEYGASYWRVMDLAGSVWERVITVGSPDGRAFTGGHGDGRLGDRGRADVADWPHDPLGRNGHGYRGGGYLRPRSGLARVQPVQPDRVPPLPRLVGSRAVFRLRISGRTRRGARARLTSDPGPQATPV